MKKQSQIKDQIIITITLIAVFGILVLSVIWLANNDPKYDPRLDADAEADYHQSVRRYQLMDDYMEILHIKGEYTIEDDVVIFQGREQEMWRLIEIEGRLEKVGINFEDYGYHLKIANRLDNYGTNIYDATTEQW